MIFEHSDKNRFELPISQGVSAKVSYRSEGNRLVLLHTEVPYAFSGQGIGSELAVGVFEEARLSRRKLVLHCTFMQRFYARHPQYSDVVVD